MEVSASEGESDWGSTIAVPVAQHWRVDDLLFSNGKIDRGDFARSP